MPYFSDHPSERLAQLRSLNPAQRTETIAALTHDAPIQPFPYGMTTSVAPIAVVLGVSPGNGLGLSADATVGKSGPTPTCGDVPTGFDHRDRSNYWPKVADLCSFLIRRLDPMLSASDALALAGHLNIGTGQYGTATTDAVEMPMVRWVSALLFARLQPRVIVTWGNQTLLRQNPVIAQAWNHPNGLRMDWHQPHRRIPFGRYSFKFWQAERADGRSVIVIQWPNHPSRPPFSGGVDSIAWTEAKSAAGALVNAG